MSKMNWQPMDTAPRDGTEFLLWSTLWHDMKPSVVPCLCMFSDGVFQHWCGFLNAWMPITPSSEQKSASSFAYNGFRPSESYRWAPLADLNLPTEEGGE